MVGTPTFRHSTTVRTCSVHRAKQLITPSICRIQRRVSTLTILNAAINSSNFGSRDREAAALGTVLCFISICANTCSSCGFAPAKRRPWNLSSCYSTSLFGLRVQLRRTWSKQSTSYLILFLFGRRGQSRAKHHAARPCAGTPF